MGGTSTINNQGSFLPVWVSIHKGYLTLRVAILYLKQRPPQKHLFLVWAKVTCLTCVFHALSDDLVCLVTTNVHGQWEKMGARKGWGGGDVNSGLATDRAGAVLSKDRAAGAVYGLKRMWG